MNANSGTINHHLHTLYLAGRYILQYGGQVTESQLLWNVPIEDAEYAFLIDYGYLKNDGCYNITLAPIWEILVRDHYNMNDGHKIVWSEPAQAEFDRYTKQLRLDEDHVVKMKRECESVAANDHLVGLLTVLQVENGGAQ